jgi:hypothetical protein
MMPTPDEIKAMNEKITSLRQTAEALKRISADIPALDRNLVRLLASVKMLELNMEGANLKLKI